MTGTATVERKRKKRNKSAAIRAYIEANPSAGPTEVVNALKAKKMTVTPTLVSNVKNRMTGGQTTGKRKGKRGRPAGVSSDKVSINSLIVAKKFADQVGSIEAARQALETLSRLN
jgi:hypothetical protein